MYKNNHFKLVIVMTVFSVLVSNASSFARPSILPDVRLLQQTTGEGVEITWNPATNTPSFFRGQIPTSTLRLSSQVSPSTTAITFLDLYANLFGIEDTTRELLVVQEDLDDLGMEHITFGQVYQGVEVYNAMIKVHLTVNGQDIVAVSNGFIPDISLPSVNPQISSEQALLVAQKALPDGSPTKNPQMVVYPGYGSAPGASAKLAWLIELRDDSIPARNVYIVDAFKGTILDVVQKIYDQNSIAIAESALSTQTDQPYLKLDGGGSARLAWLDGSGQIQSYGATTENRAIAEGLLVFSTRVPTSRNRLTYTASGSYNLPGSLVRSEGNPPTGDQDVDNAHDFAGATYDYYWNTYSRDSYDGQGASLISTAHYGSGYQNAFWNGEQMVYGDGFPVEDVAAHELTHAVTENSANLEYRWQAGALNESFSDIFSAMVDRDDWLIGEDLPPEALGGREAIRDLSDPPRFGQPDNTNDWVETCSDNEGVHTNSGIPNKAYYDIATAITKDKAEHIYYRALTVYIQSTSSLEDARAAALQSAQDIYGNGSTEYNAVLNGFDSVGLDGNWNPPTNDCTCAVSTALSGTADEITTLDIATTLYRVRDELMTSNATGLAYLELYDRYTGHISYLMLLDSSLKSEGTHVLQGVTSGLSYLMDGQGEKAIVTHKTADEIVTFLEHLAADDRTHGDGKLAQTIEREMARVDCEHLIGMTYEEAWDYIQSRVVVHTVYVPLVVR